ncbi:hypothetical protein MBLNU230_g0761t1 [Neophaeotheca triangularis]
MSSSIFYKFKSQKDTSQITFDGTSLSVFEVKRDIIAQTKLGDGTDFDLEIFTSDETKEKYDDDTVQIPRSTTVIASRRPAAVPGKGRAARYVSGKMPVMAKNHHRLEFGPNSSTPARGTPVVSSSTATSDKPMTEDERLQAVLNEGQESWNADKEAMALNGPVRNTFKKNGAKIPDGVPGPGYTCYRCQKKGHWIEKCPTNGDPNFDGKRIKKATGIPRSQLETVEVVRDEEGNIDYAQLPNGVMTLGEDFVIMKPDQETFKKFQDTTKAAAEKVKEVDVADKELRDRGLECEIDNRLFVNPHKTPCCGKTYCFDCIENNLLDNDLKCPNCGEEALLDELVKDEDKAKEITEYREEKKAAKEAKAKEGSESPAAATPQPEDEKSPAANSSNSTPTSKTNGRKRAASDELENDRKPANPAAANSKQGTPAKPSAPAPPKGPAQSEAQHLLQQMAAAVSGGPQQAPNPAMMNPMMMGMNPSMMGMNGMNPMMMGGMPGMVGPGGGMMGGMGMNNGMGYGGNRTHNGGGMNGYPPAGPRNMYNGGQNGGMGWNGQQQQGGWGMGRGGMLQGGAGQGGNDGAYFRNPVNPQRAQGRQRRQRSVDYKQM